MKKRKAYKPKPLRLPKIYTAHRDFYEIYKLFDSIESGYVDFADGHIVQKNSDKELYAVLPAIEGWMEYFRGLANVQGVEYDDSALKRMVKSLEYDKPLSLEEVYAARDVVDAQYKLYMRSGYRSINKLAYEMQGEMQ